MNPVKNGPIHFYPTADRDAYIGHIVEYCVQLGERQPITKSQVSWLVVSNQVKLDGVDVNKLTTRVAQGAWEMTVRGRKHHVVVHPAIFE